MLTGCEPDQSPHPVFNPAPLLGLNPRSAKCAPKNAPWMSVETSSGLNHGGLGLHSTRFSCEKASIPNPRSRRTAAIAFGEAQEFKGKNGHAPIYLGSLFRKVAFGSVPVKARVFSLATSGSCSVALLRYESWALGCYGGQEWPTPVTQESFIKQMVIQHLGT